MKKRVRITPDEARVLGVTEKPTEAGRSTFRAYLNSDQLSQLKEVKHKGVVAFCDERGIDFNSVKEYWDKTKEYSIRVRPEVLSYSDISADIIKEMDAHSPNYKKIKRNKLKSPHLLVVDPADIHVGKLASAFETGEDYNMEIAVQRVREGITGILDKCHGFDLEKIILVIGNDILHIDTPKRQTTSGTFQDTDGMWYESFMKAKALYVEIIERLIVISDVHVMYNPSNHDYTNGFFLADVIQSWFRKSKNVTFDCSITHRKYYKYGKNLIGTTHGDGARVANLPLLMAVEAKNMWSKCNHRYVYTHHVHHKNAKDYTGVTVESLRSPSSADSWHHRNGYQHNPKAIEGFVHHPEHGQIARLTHIF